MALAQQFKMLAFTASELDPILNDIDRLFGVGFYYAAIHIALSVPDICSSLELGPDERGRFRIEGRYVAWCQTYLQPKFGIFTSEDCWALRGGVVHNGMLFGHPKAQYDRVVFQPPGLGDAHEVISDNNGGSQQIVLLLNVHRFCHLMIAAAQEWHANKGSDPTVRDNMRGLVRTRPEGFPPHFSGFSIIA